MKIKCYLEINKKNSADANLVVLEGQGINGKFKFKSYPDFWEDGKELEVEIIDPTAVSVEAAEVLDQLKDVDEKFREEVLDKAIETSTSFKESIEQVVEATKNSSDSLVEVAKELERINNELVEQSTTEEIISIDESENIELVFDKEVKDVFENKEVEKVLTTDHVTSVVVNVDPSPEKDSQEVVEPAELPVEETEKKAAKRGPKPKNKTTE
jgi:hypothetical protein